MKRMLILLLSSNFFCVANSTPLPWTWTYSKHLALSNSDCLLPTIYLRGEDLGHNATRAFSQLVFSWNAERPAVGFFRFSARVKYKNSREWSPWCPMMEWGAGIQRSFVRKGLDPHSEYLYVRLEMLHGIMAEDFQIKMEAIEGADVRSLVLASVCVSNFHSFYSENTADYEKLTSLYIDGVPLRSQMLLDHPRNSVLCSPTSLSMVAHYLSKQDIDPVNFSEGVFDNGLGVYGSWPFNIAHAYERCGGNVLFKVSRLSTFRHLYDYLAQGVPIVVSVRGELVGAPQPYPHGHLLVVIGYDARTGQVVCHDPAHKTDGDVLTRYDLGAFLAAWERSYRLAYVAQLV